MLTSVEQLAIFLSVAGFWQPSHAARIYGASSIPRSTSVTSAATFAPTALTTPLAELRRRQQSAIQTCGFVSGDPSRAVTCSPSYYCAAAGTFVGCCISGDCRNVYTSCYDVLGPICDQSCQSDPQNVICPSSKPYCAVFNYPSGSIGLGCESFSGLTANVLLTSTLPPSALTTPSISSTTSTPTSTTSAAPTPKSHSLSPGSIAGIVIGVLAGIALSGLAAYFAIRKVKHSKTHNNKAEPEIADTPATATTVAPMRQSGITELSDTSTQQQWRQSDSTTPDRSGRTSYQVQSMYVPGHHGREFTITPGELPDTSRPLSVPSTEATANTAPS